MTDLEISKALALAIGWAHKRMFVDGARKLRVARQCGPWQWQVFDYRDWNVIGPIATKYDCFPMKNGRDWGCAVDGASWSEPVSADTPQKAIALAVIEGAKK